MTLAYLSIGLLSEVASTPLLALQRPRIQNRLPFGFRQTTTEQSPPLQACLPSAICNSPFSAEGSPRLVGLRLVIPGECGGAGETWGRPLSAPRRARARSNTSRTPYSAPNSY